MVTEQENLNFRYFSYLCIIGVTKYDRADRVVDIYSL